MRTEPAGVWLVGGLALSVAPQRHRDAVLPRQFLAHHLGIATVLAERLRQPRLQPVQLVPGSRPTEWCSSARLGMMAQGA